MTRPARKEVRLREEGASAAEDPAALRRRDQEWAEGIRTGDEACFSALFHAYYKRLHAFAEGYVRSPEAAEDLTVDVFARLWERRAEWEVRGSVRSYLYVAVRNQALDYLEHQRVVNRVHSGLSSGERQPGMGSPPPPADAEAEARELAEAIERALEHLSERSREAFILHRQRGLSYAEVGQAMGVAPRTVEVHIRRAFQSLRSQLAGFLALLLSVLP